MAHVRTGGFHLAVNDSFHLVDIGTLYEPVQESGDVPDPDILLGIDQFARFVRTEALDQSFVNLTIDLVRLCCDPT